MPRRGSKKTSAALKREPSPGNNREGVTPKKRTKFSSQKQTGDQKVVECVVQDTTGDTARTREKKQKRSAKSKLPKKDGTRKLAGGVARKTKKRSRRKSIDAKTIVESNPELSEKAKAIAEVLERLYPDPPIPLNFRDPFTLLVAVMLSAQTTDSKVNDVTIDLFDRCPTPHDLAEIEYEDLLEMVRSVGLAPTKSKNLIKMAKLLVEKFNGVVPTSSEDLESLPGVGPKTAAVVLSQAYNVPPRFAVDTHVHRLARRWGLAPESANVRVVEQHLSALYPEDTWGKVHLQMIYFGREWCQAKVHVPSDCPVCCWVGKGGTPLSAEAIEKMVPPKKASKRIILYSERLDEQRRAPKLVRSMSWVATQTMNTQVKNAKRPKRTFTL
mmetsp:Transcript_13359/g.26157  ORF Transcript_13359/g.26157 Transcript_13359/m.26157 type:complete len:384 (-) Transcript_13359:186-1337(-)